MQRKGKLRKGVASSKARQRRGCGGRCCYCALKPQSKSLSKGRGSNKLHRFTGYSSEPINMPRGKALSAYINAHGYDLF